MGSARVLTDKGFYRQLNNACSADIQFDALTKRNYRSMGKKSQFFPVERIISRRKRNRSNEYLVKWSGYSNFDNTWENEENLTPDLVTHFDQPFVPQDRLQKNIDKLEVAIISKLKSRGRLPATIDFDHDCFRLLFHGKGKAATSKLLGFYEREDFNGCNFSTNWGQCLDGNGDGVKVKFPIKMKVHLSKSPKVFTNSKCNGMIERKRIYLERLTFDIIREPFTLGLDMNC